MTPKAKSFKEAVEELELLDRPELRAIAQGMALDTSGSRPTLITSIILTTHPRAARASGRPEPVAVQEGF